MASPDQYDPRIVMVPGYRRPRPDTSARRRRRARLKKRALIALGVVTAITLLAWGAEVWLGSDVRLPQLVRAADYRPAVVTRLYARSGDIVAESVGARRTVLSPAELPERVARAVVARWEPQFFARPPLGQIELGSAIYAACMGRPARSSITLGLAHSLTAALPERGLTRLIKEWIVALRLERHLRRAEILQIYLNEVPFGPGRYGIEEGARALFGRSARELDEGQAKALAELAGSDAGPAWSAPEPTSAPGCGQEALQVLGARMPSEELLRFGEKVVTPCEPALTRIADGAIRRQHLERAGLVGAAVVLRMPENELVTVVGAHEAAHPIGVLRAPLVIARALSSLKFTAASSFDDKGAPISLRALALRSPSAAADALYHAGVSKASVLDLGTRTGLGATVTSDGLAKGTAPITPLEAASALSTFAAGGLYRLPQLLVSIGDTPESEGAKATMPVLDPASSYLATSLLQLPSAWRQKIARPVAGVLGGDESGAWFGGYGPELVVVVWVGPPAGAERGKGAEPERAAGAIATEIFAAAVHGKPGRPFERPVGVLTRRIDGAGRLLPRGASGGSEEWFVPGSLPREDIELPREER